MQRVKLLVLGVCLVLLGVSTTCFASVPPRIAILPVINQSYVHDDAVEKVISEALAAKFQRPLSQIVTIYNVLPAADVRAALLAEIPPGADKRKFDVNILQRVAARLNADIVIGAVITSLSEGMNVGKEDILLQTSLSIRVVGYSAPEGRSFAFADYEDYFGTISRAGFADHLAGVIMERLMGKLKFPYDK